jgi:hypothetical protein
MYLRESENCAGRKNVSTTTFAQNMFRFNKYLAIYGQILAESRVGFRVVVVKIVLHKLKLKRHEYFSLNNRVSDFIKTNQDEQTVTGAPQECAHGS